MKLSRQDWSLIGQARKVAVRAHDGQLYGKQIPYSWHLEQVFNVLLRFQIADGNILAAAWLHDILEDTDVFTPESLAEKFNPHIAQIVWAVSDGPGATRAERKARMYKEVPLVDGALSVKLADRIANVEASYSLADGRDKLVMYRREHAYFAEQLFSIRGIPSEFRMWQYLDVLLESTK